MARRVYRGWKEGKRAKKGDVKVKQGKRICPGNIRARIGDSGRGEQDVLMVVDDAVSGGSKTVPQGPKATGGVGARGVVGMLTEEVAVMHACRGVSSSVRVKKIAG
jgi:hypothetical protein